MGVLETGCILLDVGSFSPGAPLMLLIHRSQPYILVLAAVLISSRISPAQAPAPGESVAAHPPAACVPMANLAFPTRAAIEAKVTSLDTAHLKPGNDIWFKIVRPFNYPSCSLDVDSVVYARIVSVSATKNPNSAEISLAFDRADCNHHNAQPLKLKVIAVVGPPGEAHHVHEDMPSEVAGGVRQIGQAVFASALDEDLNPGGPPHTIRPGIVVGIRNLKLEPTAGPDCSDKITSDNSRIQLAAGSELILAMTVTRVIRKPQSPPTGEVHP